MRVHLGVPVLRRYDLLRELLLSAQAGTRRPGLTVVVDNGRRADRIAEALAGITLRVEVFAPAEPLGVAASWNYLLRRLPEERIIANDDVIFEPDSIEKICETAGDLIFGHGYSCFLMRDSATEKIGFFDEAISPGYAYWEDIDYDMRVRLACDRGVDFVQANAPCVVRHRGSQTNAVATSEEVLDHHRKFGIALHNMREKYRHLPFDQQHPTLQPHLRWPGRIEL